MLIILAGKARSGKDTFGMYLKLFLQCETNIGCDLMAFAKPLKDKVGKDFDLTYDQLHGSLKDVPDGRFPKIGDRNSEDHELSPIFDYYSPRELLQMVGEFYRYIVPTFWIDKLWKSISSNLDKHIVITDARLPLEIQTMLKYVPSAITIAIKRSDRDIIATPNHYTETALDSFSGFDFIINNDGTTKDLEQKAFDVVKAILDTQKQ